MTAETLTAIWFYPPFGTPSADQTAYFFHLLASVLAGTDDRLADFPRLREYVRTRFTPAARIGIFRILRLREGGSAPP